MQKTAPQSGKHLRWILHRGGQTRGIHGQSVPVERIEEIDELIGYRPGHWRPFGGTHPARRNRSEFVRLAIVEKLERDKACNTGCNSNTAHQRCRYPPSW